MRRTTKRLLLNLSVFGVSILIILYLNFPEPNKTFKWTKVRYQTSTIKLPDIRGICPGLKESSKPALIVARTGADGDTSWLDSLTDIYHPCIYNADSPIDLTSRHLQVPENRGHEAMTYLTFLIDNYANVPESGAVFVHGSRFAWHNDWPEYDNAKLLRALNISNALAPYGYHNLRCDWSASACESSSTPPQRSLETTLRALLAPGDARVVSDAALPQALESLFAFPGQDGHVQLGRSHAIRSQCCAQFVVSRHRVWQHSRDEYVALRQWLLDGSNKDQREKLQRNNAKAAPADDRVAGRILSYIWHILFMPQEKSSLVVSDIGTFNAVDLESLNNRACPRAEECYCRLYGRCQLKGCTDPGHCNGEYAIPAGFKLPEDWARMHQ